METKDRADALVGEMFKLLPAVSGVMLALMWGLAGKTRLDSDVMTHIHIASLLLIVTIFVSLLGLQFMVSALQGNKTYDSGVGTKGSVAGCFFFAWVFFFIGCVFVVWSLFEI
jgi:hypothetical protein